MTRERITDALDVLGLLALAVGVAGGLWPVISWPAIAAGGVVILAGSVVASLTARPRGPKTIEEAKALKAKTNQGSALIRSVS